MAFDEERLPETVEKRSQGGAVLRVDIVELESGHEQRVRRWSQPRARWDISYGITTAVGVPTSNSFKEVEEFWYRREGNTRGFRFKNWMDYSVTGATFGTGDGSTTVFQLGTIFAGTAPQTYKREIYKVAQGTTPTFYVDGTPQTIPTNVDYDEDTGLVTFVSPPGNTLALTWDGEFDVPVRFNNSDDWFKIVWELGAIGQESATLPSLEIIETRDIA